MLGGDLSSRSMACALIATLAECVDGRSIELIVPHEGQDIRKWVRSAEKLNRMRRLDPRVDVSAELGKHPPGEHGCIELVAIARRVKCSVGGHERPVHASLDAIEAPIKAWTGQERARDTVIIVATKPEHIAGLHQHLTDNQQAVTALSHVVPATAINSQTLSRASYLLSHSVVSVFRADAAFESAPPDLQRLARGVGLSPDAQLERSIGRLAQACREEFTTWLSGTQDKCEAERNAAGAKIVDAVIRDYFKSGAGQGARTSSLKSPNKGYASNSPVTNRDGREQRRQDSSVELDKLREANAPLEHFIAKKVGQCGEMAALALHLARHLGLTANVWGFTGAEDSHGLCVIGRVPKAIPPGGSQPPHGPIQLAGRTDTDGDLTADGVWIVDRWADVCMPGKEYFNAFANKMQWWGTLKKVISLADGSGGGEWVYADSEKWANATFRSKLQKHTIPNIDYSPE